MAKAKLIRDGKATLVEAGGFSVTVKLTGFCAVDHFPLCKTIADVERCASMGDFKILGYDFTVLA